MKVDSERFTRFATRGVPRTRRGLIVFITVPWSLCLILMVYLFVVTSQEGPDEVFPLVVVPLSILLGIVVVGLVVAFSTTIPGRLREMSLRRRHPGTVVKTSGLSVWDREAISTMRNGMPTPRYLLFSAALAFDADGISVWTGVFRPERIAHLPWSEVMSIRVLEKTHVWRVIQALSIGSTTNDTDLQFTMVSRRGLGIALAQKAELEQLTVHLVGLAKPGR